MIYTHRCCTWSYVNPGREGGIDGLILITETWEVVPPRDVAGQLSHPGLLALVDILVTTHFLTTRHFPLVPLSAELENNGSASSLTKSLCWLTGNKTPVSLLIPRPLCETDERRSLQSRGERE